MITGIKIGPGNTYMNTNQMKDTWKSPLVSTAWRPHDDSAMPQLDHFLVSRTPETALVSCDPDLIHAPGTATDRSGVQNSSFSSLQNSLPPP